MWAKALEVHLHEFGPRSAAFHASAAALLQKEDMVPTSFWDHPAVVAVAEHYIALDTQDADEHPEEVAQEADVDDPARRGDDHGRE